MSSGHVKMTYLVIYYSWIMRHFVLSHFHSDCTFLQKIEPLNRICFHLLCPNRMNHSLIIEEWSNFSVPLLLNQFWIYQVCRFNFRCSLILTKTLPFHFVLEIRIYYFLSYLFLHSMPRNHLFRLSYDGWRLEIIFTIDFSQSFSPHLKTIAQYRN